MRSLHGDIPPEERETSHAARDHRQCCRNGPYDAAVSTDLVTAPTTARSRRLRLTAAGVAVVVVAALGFGLHWWTHPTAFESLGDSYSSDPLPVSDAALSTTVVFPRVDEEPETVTIHGLHAVFATNTANATATFSICHMAPGEEPIGAVHAPDTVCHDIEPAKPGSSLHLGVAPDSDYLFVTAAPTTPGVAHLTRVELDYSRGTAHLYQRGTQSIRVDRTITAR